MMLAQRNRISNFRSSDWILDTIPAFNKDSIVSKQQTAAIEWMEEGNTLNVEQKIQRQLQEHY